MVNGFDLIYNIIEYGFLIIYIIMFYLSLKKCFLEDKKRSVKLFFLALVTNPMVLFLVSLVLAILFEGLIMTAVTGKDFTYIVNEAVNDQAMSLAWTLMGGFLYIVLTIFFSLLIGKWLKAPNISMVTFIYLMFAVIDGLSGGNVSGKDSSLAIPPDIINLISIIVFIVAVLLLYFFVIRALCVLTDRKRQINWRLFLIPPAVFLQFYYVFDFFTFIHGDVFADVVMQVYSLIVLYLFIWAFYVIIKNINSMNAAIEAKYESEHDKLTGLYNKGKYMTMKDDHFGNPSSIAIFNFDVNNLKNINDTYGHERGDELIIKAARSIQAVVSDKVYGFRSGGDEYVMVAVDITKDEMQDIYQKWEKALDELNKEGDVYCVMACGLEYAKGEFNYDELYKQADEKMYMVKKALKEKGQTSHLKISDGQSFK